MPGGLGTAIKPKSILAPSWLLQETITQVEELVVIHQSVWSTEKKGDNDRTMYGMEEHGENRKV